MEKELKAQYFSLYAWVVPSGLNRPRIVSIRGVSYTVAWSSPLSDGGWPITSIKVYRDDGAGGDLTTLVVTVTDGSLKYVDTLTSSDQWKTFRVAVVATNTIRGVTSSSTSFVLANLPAVPTPAPWSDTSLTSISQIVVNFEDINTDTGGAPILEYCLQMDDGIGDELSIVFCSAHETTYAATNVTRGEQYRFRYEVMNAVGWSPYSETSYISPTSVPDAPPKPEFVSGSDTQIDLTFQESPDDNDVPIVNYQLEIDSGNNLTSDFHIVTGYAGLTMSYSLDSTTDSLGSPGTIYRVRFVAINGDLILGDYSGVLLVALGSLPSKPSTPTKTVSSSTSSTISIQWAEVTGDTLPIKGYKLYSDSGRAESLILMFDGSKSPGTRTYSLTNVYPSLTYRVRVTAINMNGEGPASNIAYLTACTTPSGFSAPKINTFTQTSIKFHGRAKFNRRMLNHRIWNIFGTTIRFFHRIWSNKCRRKAFLIKIYSWYVISKFWRNIFYLR